MLSCSVTKCQRFVALLEEANGLDDMCHQAGLDSSFLSQVLLLSRPRGCL